ncbi:MAG: hypothetical protein ABI548_11195 [Polyangiaceae bacterium]
MSAARRSAPLRAMRRSVGASSGHGNATREHLPFQRTPGPFRLAPRSLGFSQLTVDSTLQVLSLSHRQILVGLDEIFYLPCFSRVALEDFVGLRECLQNGKHVLQPKEREARLFRDTHHFANCPAQGRRILPQLTLFQELKERAEILE